MKILHIYILASNIYILNMCYNWKGNQLSLPNNRCLIIAIPHYYHYINFILMWMAGIPNEYSWVRDASVIDAYQSFAL